MPRRGPPNPTFAAIAKHRGSRTHIMRTDLPLRFLWNLRFGATLNRRVALLEAP
jgi:hypothetical protein